MNNTKIKMVFVLSTLTGGGAERVTLNIINKLDRNRFDISMILLQNYGEYLSQVPKDIKLYILDNIKRTLFSLPALRKLLNNIEADIVYTTIFHTSIALFLSTIGLNNKPKIVLRNPISPKIIIEENDISLFYRIALNVVYNKVDLVIAQTPEMKDELFQYFKVNKKNIKVFINPIDMDRIDNLTMYETIPFDKNKMNIVAAGRLSYEKGFDVLLYAFEKVIKKNNNFFLHIIGRDEGEYKNLILLIKKLSLNRYVKLWGFQQNPYIFFKYSDLYVLSSRREGLPNTVLENLYLGKPIIATNCIPFISTLIKNGENGFIVNVNDSEELADKILRYKEIDSDNIQLELEFGNPNQLFNDVIN